MGYNKIPRIKFFCDYCRNSSTSSPSHYNRKNRHFCSTKCYSLFRKHYLPKEEQHAFGSGLSEKERKFRATVRTLLNHAVRDGKVKKLSCEVCGEEKTQAHHPDYKLALEVQWLCIAHHWDKHRIYENKDLLTNAS